VDAALEHSRHIADTRKFGSGELSSDQEHGAAVDTIATAVHVQHQDRQLDTVHAERTALGIVDDDEGSGPDAIG
jgi:hypothetical protein